MRQRIGNWASGGVVIVALGACNSLDPKEPEVSQQLIVPVDERPTAQALSTAPAISGGTLAATPDDKFAIAADPDRDRVSIVNLQTSHVDHVGFDRGSEPGRVVTDSAGHAFVALRRVGDVVGIDVASAQVLHRTHVCAAARGMAVDETTGVLHVACADGRLVSVRAANGDIVRERNFQTDLRDITVVGDGLLVSTFKGAQLLHLDGSGELIARSETSEFTMLVPKPVQAAVTDTLSSGAPFPSQRQAPLTPQTMKAHLAWRMVQGAPGEAFMLHQGSSEAEVDISQQHEPTAMSSPYGGARGAGTCGGIVTPAVTRLTSDGVMRTLPVSSGVLSVDMAFDARTSTLAVVQAGAADPEAPQPITVIRDASGGSSSGGASVGPAPAPLPSGVQAKTSSTVSIMSIKGFGVQPGGACAGMISSAVAGQATAVTFTPSGTLVVQSREPALLTIGGIVPGAVTVGPARVVSLGGQSVVDTGHELFHRDAGGGIACASCHAEGAEDGHTWKFSGIGVRRTQALHVGLEGTAPFHWNGDESDLGHLMEDVFVGRMGGVHQSSQRVEALTDWLFSLRPPAAMVPAENEAAVRGKVLFEDAGCASCHNGEKFTNNKTVDVGTGAKVQVPSLLGVGYRAPLMHTGCAATLEDRFDPECGGNKHGDTANLDAEQVQNLVAFLRTL